MDLKEEIIDKAAEQAAIVAGHAFDAGYAAGAESRQDEMDTMIAENNKMKHNINVLKDTLEKILTEV